MEGFLTNKNGKMEGHLQLPLTWNGAKVKNNGNQTPSQKGP